MSATVRNFNGDAIVLSPTGVQALSQAMEDHNRSAWTDPAVIHPATRQKLIHAGLLRWVDPDDPQHHGEPQCAAIDVVLGITDAGMVAARTLADASASGGKA